MVKTDVREMPSVAAEVQGHRTKEHSSTGVCWLDKIKQENRNKKPLIVQRGILGSVRLNDLAKGHRQLMANSGLAHTES